MRILYGSLFNEDSEYSARQKECLDIYKSKTKHCFDSISRDECFYEIHIDVDDSDTDTIYALANLLTTCNPPLIIVNLASVNGIIPVKVNKLYDKLERMLVSIGCYKTIWVNDTLDTFTIGQLNLGKLNLIPEDE